MQVVHRYEDKTGGIQMTRVWETLIECQVYLVSQRDLGLALTAIQ